MADIDIQKIFNKRENEDARQEIIDEEVPEEEYLSAAEWVSLGNYIQSTISDVTNLKEHYVKGIRQNNILYEPIDNIITLPGADTTVRLVTSEPSSFVTISDRVIIHLRANSVEGGADTYENVLVEVSTAAIGSENFTKKGSFNIRAKSTTSEEFDEVDITDFLDNGKQQVYFIATGLKTGVSGYLLFNMINRTQLELELVNPWQMPILARENVSGFPLSYHLKGAVPRKLYIKISGNQYYMNDGVTLRRNQTMTYQNDYTIPENEYTSFLSTWSNVLPDLTGTYGILNHGVHTIEAWLTCDDGQGNTLESKHQVNQIMVINEDSNADLTKSYLILQNIETYVTNYVMVEKFCEFAFWNPKSAAEYTIASPDPVILSFLVTDYSTISAEGYTVEYSRQEPSVRSNTKYTLSATIEIDDTEQSTLYGYFRVYEGQKEILSLINPITDGGVYIAIEVDNKEKFAPTPGADFWLNPKNRNNSEANPRRILNAAKSPGAAGYEIPATFDNFSFISDGWITSEDDGQKVLRVLAGQKLTINYDTFVGFSTVAATDLTIELDFKTKNITNEEEQIFGINEIIAATATAPERIMGIQLAPIDGIVLTNSASVELEQDMHWMEDQRTRLSFNIVQNIITKEGDPTSAIALCRIYMDGIICREFIWKKEIGEWYQKGSQIVIGQDHADIDIYSIRVYKKELTALDILKDYIATLPTVDEKIKMRDRNNILGADGYISKTLVENNIKGNTMTYHASRLPDHRNQGNSLGWVEIKRFDVNGNYLPRKSGTICKATKSITFKGQGATAKTYYYWNTHYKLDDITDLITIPLTQFDKETFGVLEPWHDTETGKDFITIEGPQNSGIDPGNIEGDWEVTYIDGVPYASVPDGFIDGDNNYRGRGYKAGEGWFDNDVYYEEEAPFGYKLCDKINYASPMQSHKMGGVAAYNDLHTAIVGKNTQQQRWPGTRVACLQDCYYRFIQTSDTATPIFDGVDTYGSAKADKVTLGYHKKHGPYYPEIKESYWCMIEGSDNSLPLTDFRVPFDDDVTQHLVVEDAEIDGWSYNGQVSLDFTQGGTVKIAGIKYPLPQIEENTKKLCNFLYTHNPRIKVFVGSKDDFLTSDLAINDTGYKYWCTAGEHQYELIRYNYVLGTWVDAGTWDATNEVYIPGLCKLNEIYSSLFDRYSGQWDVLNEAIVNAVVAAAKTKIESNTLIKSDSLRFHYNYINQFEAGTDNCSKNTYIVFDDCWPTGTDAQGNPTYGIWEFQQDDLDTTKKTDNSGRQLKPYYIKRDFDVRFDGIDPETGRPIYVDGNYYVGRGNVLFNLCEKMWEKTGENRAMISTILTTMANLVAQYNLKHKTSYSESPWGFEELYFFRIQRYYAEVAYNETARIRYEYPASQNYVSDRGIYPMTQSVGNQLQTELEYYKRRILLFASYAQWGELSVEAGTATIGLPGVDLRFGCEINATTASGRKPSFVPTVTPHQFLYPCGRIGQSNKWYGSIVAPGEAVQFDISQGADLDDTTVSVCGANYYRSFGNLGDISASLKSKFAIQGKRLIEVIAVPSTPETPDFRPPTFEIIAPLVETINMTGCKDITNILDVSSNIRLRDVKLNNTGFTEVRLPQTPTLRHLELPAGLNTLSIQNLVSLDPITGFSIQGVDDLKDITIRQSTDIVAHSFYARLGEALD